jgi:hypothetical protein
MKIPTKHSPQNIEKILGTLVDTPARLRTLSRARSRTELSAPLSPGQWSFTEVLAHLNACAELSTQAIYYALLVENPVLPDVHPQRNWAKLLRYDRFSVGDLLTSFSFRRVILSGKLSKLSEVQWERPMTRGRKRPENIYRIARSLAIHEVDHITQLATLLRD